MKTYGSAAQFVIDMVILNGGWDSSIVPRSARSLAGCLSSANGLMLNNQTLPHAAAQPGCRLPLA
jgi:hypothetical protein